MRDTATAAPEPTITPAEVPARPRSGLDAFANRLRGPARILSLQRAIGNRAVARLIGEDAQRESLDGDQPQYGGYEGAGQDPGVSSLAPETPSADPTIGPASASPLDSPRKGNVTAITAITTPTGAVTGFPTINGVDLNVPGTRNSATTGECRVVFQIRFDLAGISANEVELVRTKKGVRGPVGSEQPASGADGPSDPTRIRKGSMIAVSDDPGIARAEGKYFPMRYTMDFSLYCFDIVSKAILGTATYSVNIAKQKIDDPSPVAEFKNLKTKIN